MHARNLKVWFQLTLTLLSPAVLTDTFWSARETGGKFLSYHSLSWPICHPRIEHALIYRTGVFLNPLNIYTWQGLTVYIHVNGKFSHSHYITINVCSLFIIYLYTRNINKKETLKTIFNRLCRKTKNTSIYLSKKVLFLVIYINAKFTHCLHIGNLKRRK